LLRHLDQHHQAPTALTLYVVVGGVVANVAMDEPFARLQCRPYDIVALSRTDVDGVGLDAKDGAGSGSPA